MTTIEFPAGIPGFESCRRYVLIQSDELHPGVCLKGLDENAPTFFLVDPRAVVADYVCDLTPADRARLGAEEDTACVWLALVSCAGEEPRVNLRAPIVINPARMRGIQVVPAESPWAADTPWLEAACSS
jgi:flagellar assembly factor FliW